MNTTLLRKVKIFTIFVIVLFSTGCSKEKEIPYLVIISFDGFRWDYADSCNTPFLDYMAHAGVKAEYLEPGFPTVTFPNHYAIATGLYPGNCGLVHNNFYDKKTGRFYSIGNRNAVEDSMFYKGVPLWNLLQQHKIKTATCFWVGSEAPVNGMYANYWMKYDGSLPFKSRIDTVIAWLRKPENERPRLVMAYFSEPDHIGHEAGPFTPETNSVAESMDSLMGYFFNQLKKTKLRNKVNIIVLSDHGMAKVDSSQNIVLNNYIKKNWIERQT
ncbi:MAG: alkaline phosphatase family protein, partial [Bacteroidales bacterium]|nr:alkaline phosphatase family protein [Bacteroidales bacterium]